MSIIDHVSLPVADYPAAKAFYTRVLRPLGIELLMEPPMGTGPAACGFGRDRKPDFWLGQARNQVSPIHLCFAARSRAEVDAFYREALAAGATDNGPPGLRPRYHPSYYGAFVRDADGHNIEAASHRPEP